MPDRPNNADLAKPATDLLAARALEALRGPMSRGAAPTAELAKRIDRPRSTVSRQIDRETGRPDSTAFDLVIYYAFNAEKNGQQPKWEGVIGSYVAAQGPPGLPGGSGFAEPVMKKMLVDGFAETAKGDARTIALVGYLLHVSALLCCGGDGSSAGVGVGGGEAGDGEPGIWAGEVDVDTQRAAKTILEMRRESYAKSNAIYSSAIRFIFSATRRRPKSGRTVEDVVVMMHSMFDGYLIRHSLDPELYPMNALVETVWDLTLSLTEPGFLAEGPDSPLRDELVQCALELVRKQDLMPDLADLAVATDRDLSVVQAEFGDVDALAEACLERCCRHAAELRSLADETVGMARWTLKGFIAWLASLVQDYGPLVRAAENAKVWDEMSTLVDIMLMSASGHDGTPGINPQKRKEISKRLVDAVRRGVDWSLAVSTLLDMLPVGVEMPAGEAT
ncbi:MAG: hypothetical protein WAM97_21925 [Acidimicrobiales bacterium]